MGGRGREKLNPPISTPPLFAKSKRPTSRKRRGRGGPEGGEDPLNGNKRKGRTYLKEIRGRGGGGVESYDSKTSSL